MKRLPARSLHDLARTCAVILAISALLVISALQVSNAENGTDPRLALEAQVDSLRNAGAYTEAAGAARVLLRLTREDETSKPYRIVDARLRAEGLEQRAGFSAEARRALAPADSLTAVVEESYARGRYAEAIEAQQRQLAVYRQFLGEERPEIAESLLNLGFLTARGGDHVAAEPLYREALEMRRRLLGDEHPDIALNLNVLADVSRTRGDYPRADSLYREALAMARRLLGETHSDLAMILNNFAALLEKRGEYAESESMYRRALSIYREVLGEEHRFVATVLDNLGLVLLARGDHAAGEPLMRRALAMRRRHYGEEHPSVATSLGNLAMLLKERGDLATAEPLYREALAMDRKLRGEESAAVATDLNNLGALLRVRGELAQAESLLREAVTLRRSLLGNHPHVASSLNNLATVLEGLGDHQAADSLYREALTINRGFFGEEHPRVALGLANRGRLLADHGDHEEAETLLLSSLSLGRELLGNQHYQVVQTLHDLGALHMARGNHAEAETLLEQAAQAFEAARIRAGPGLSRATFGASPYPALAATRLALGKEAEAWPACERSLARVLSEMLHTAGSRPLTAAETACEDSLRRGIGDAERLLAVYRREARSDSTIEAAQRVKETRDRLLELEAEWSIFQHDLAGRYPVTEGQAYPLECIQATLSRNEAILGWLDVEVERGRWKSWAYAICNQGPVRWSALPGGEGSPVERAQRLRESLSSPGVGDLQAGATTLHELWSARIQPVIHHLEDVDELIILPSGAMLGIPVEAFTDSSGGFLGDRFGVSYAPSATIYAWLAERVVSEAPAVVAALLAGDPPYRPSHVAPAEGPGTEALAGELLAAGAALEPDLYRRAITGDQDALNKLPRLAGTRAEIEALGALLPGSTILLGPAASEQSLTSMASAGELVNFRVLHFATHAIADDETPANSALILSQVDLPDPLTAAMSGERLYDGVVSAKEILREWRLSADLVTLSACETGLGKEMPGEGYVGLASAFLQVGARSLLVGLWEVEDLATAALMQRFYENWIGRDGGEPMGKAEALGEAKQWLRTLTFDEVERIRESLGIRASSTGRGVGGLVPVAGSKPATVRPWEHPSFWAPFILIGDRD
ncbi:MAG: CHAT domain-containing protein [Candidatus Eisenbacteria sp.]|nr:CHAT domain-containing protein [Candidatus Eisenbacteria bacterium]